MIVKQVTDQAAGTVNDWLLWIALGLGVTLATPLEYLGGLLLALAGAAVARRFTPEQNKMELWTVVLAAFFCAHVALIITQHWFPDLGEPQLVMAVAGFLSRILVRMGLRFAGAVENKTDKLAERVIDRVLPEDRE